MHPTLQEWMDENRLFNAFGPKQAKFIQKELPVALFRDYDESCAYPVHVIGTHTSKGFSLPVYEIQLTDGTVLILRNNYHDWKVSVSSPRDVRADFLDLFDPAEKVDAVCCEGFPENRIYGPYAQSRRQFTVEISSDALLFTFAFILGHALGLRQPSEDTDRTITT